MKNKSNSIRSFAMHISTVFLIFVAIFMVIFTIYIQQPNPIEINLITYAGRETININNRQAFDLIYWAPGYTDQAVVKIDNNTNEQLSWNIEFEKINNIPEEIMTSIDVYIKENPSNIDILKMYDSEITNGYTFIGNLSELINNEIYSGELDSKNNSLDLSILLHVKETSNLKETPFSFENFLKINARSESETKTKIFK